MAMNTVSAEPATSAQTSALRRVLGVPIDYVVFKSVQQVQAVRKVRAVRSKVRWFEHSHVAPVGHTTRTYRTDHGSPLNTSHMPIVSSKRKIGPP